MTLLSSVNCEMLNRFLVMCGTNRMLLRRRECAFAEKNRRKTYGGDGKMVTIAHHDRLCALVICTDGEICELICYVISSPTVHVPSGCITTTILRVNIHCIGMKRCGISRARVSKMNVEVTKTFQSDMPTLPQSWQTTYLRLGDLEEPPRGPPDP